MNKYHLLYFFCTFVFLIKSQCIPSVLLCNNTNDALGCNDNLFVDPASLPNDFKTNNSRSVVKIRNSDGASGTGTLIRQAFTNGDDNQQENIIITARHVIRQGDFGQGPLTDLSKMEFFFNYSNPDGTLTDNVVCKQCRYRIVGATLIAENNIHDFAILRLNNPIPPHFKPFYSGWNVLAPAVSAIYMDIHHASGDIKKISSASGLINNPFPIRYLINWTNGVSEGGSSGSGLFNFNRRLIGVLSGGGVTFAFPNCAGATTANFGKLRNFWLTNNTVRNTLNPNNQFGLVGTSGGEIECHAGDLFLDGDYWPAQDYQPNNQIKLKCVGNMFLAHGTKTLTVKSNAEFIFEAGGQVVTLLPGFTAEAGSDVTINSNVACSASKNALPQFDIDSSSVNDYLTDDQVKALESTYINMNLSSNYFNGEDLLEINPNPSSDKFYLKTNLKVDNIYVTDALGKLVNCFIKDNIIDLSQLVGGVYFANLKVNQQIIHKKIVLNK